MQSHESSLWWVLCCQLGNVISTTFGLLTGCVNLCDNEVCGYASLLRSGTFPFGILWALSLSVPFSHMCIICWIIWFALLHNTNMKFYEPKFGSTICALTTIETKDFWVHGWKKLWPNVDDLSRDSVQRDYQPIAERCQLNKRINFCLSFRISKATNFRPKQWTPRWTIVKRPFSKSQSHQHGASSNKSQANPNGKGKLHKIKRKWRWGAGAGWTILSVLDWWLLAAGGWLSWQGVVLRWTPLGVVLVAAAQWHLHNKECARKGLPRTAPHWQVNSTSDPSRFHQNFLDFHSDRRRCTVRFRCASWADVLDGWRTVRCRKPSGRRSTAFTRPLLVSTWRKRSSPI